MLYAEQLISQPNLDVIAGQEAAIQNLRAGKFNLTNSANLARVGKDLIPAGDYAAYHTGQLGDAINQLREGKQTGFPASLVQMVGGFLEHHGQGGLTENIYHTVQQLSAGTDKPDAHLLRELDFAAVSVSAYQSVIDSPHKGDEVRQAVRVAMVDMKVERMSAHGSSELLEALRNARPSIHEELLETMEKYYGEAPDHDLFHSICEKIMHAFRMSGSALTAAGAGVEGLWDNFYRPAYQGGMYEALAADWQDFLETFETPVKLNAEG